MNITQVIIRHLYSDAGPLLAKASIVIDDELAVHDLCVISGASRMFVAMPSKSIGNHEYVDIIHPVNAQTRKQIEDAVLDKYYSARQAFEKDRNE